MGKICSVKNCPSGRKLKSKLNGTPQSLSFFRPTTPARLKNWKRSLGINLKVTDYICHLHFKEEHIKMYETFNINGKLKILCTGKKMLKEEALPTIEHQFVPMPEHKFQASLIDPLQRRNSSSRFEDEEHDDDYNSDQQELLYREKYNFNDSKELDQDFKNLTHKTHNSLKKCHLTKSKSKLDDFYNNIFNLRILPPLWLYIERTNNIEFMRINSTSMQVTHHISLNEDLSITVILPNIKKKPFKDKISSLYKINDYLKSIESWSECVDDNSSQCKATIKKIWSECRECENCHLKVGSKHITSKCLQRKGKKAVLFPCSTPMFDAGMHNVLHGFPHPERDRERFNIWLHAVGGDILKLDNDVVYRHRRVCRSHFEQKYLHYNNLLSNNAVPTLGLTCTASKSAVKRQTSPTSTAIHTGPPAKHPRRSVDQQRRASSTSTLTETDIFQDPDICLEEECATIAKEEVEESIVPIIKPFTWQKRTEAIHVKADNMGDIADNLSMYSGDEERTSPPRDIKNDTMLHEGFVCNTCQREIRGFRYTCVQCSDLDLCSACELDRAHHHHYVLRVPEPRPYAEIQLVLATIRNHLLKKLDPITQFEQYDDDAVSVKSEIKSENEDDGLKEPVPVRDDTPTHRQRQHYVEGDSAIDTNNLEMTEGTQRKTRVEKINDTHSTKATSLGVALQHKSQPASVAVQQKQQPVSVVVQHSHGPASITVQHKPQLASVAVQHKPQLASVAVQHKPLTASVAVQHNPQPATVAVQQKQQPVSVAVQQKQQPISVALQHNQAPLSAAVPHIQQPLSVAVQHQQQPLSVDVQHKQHPLSIAVQHIQQPLSIAVPHIQQPLSVALQNQQQPVSVAVQHNQQPFSVPVQQLQPVSLYVQHQQQPLSFYIQHQQQPFSVAVQPQQQPISVAIPQQQPASVAVKHEIKPDIDDVQYKHQSDTDAVKHQQQSDSDAVQLQQQSDGDAVQHEQQSDTDAVQHQKQPVNIPTDTGTHIVAKNNLKINFNDFLRVKDSAMEAKKIQVLPFPKSESKSLTQKLLTHKAQLRPGGKLILMKLPSGMLLKDGREVPVQILPSSKDKSSNVDEESIIL